MPIRELKRRPQFPIKVKKKKDLDVVVQAFLEDSSEILKSQFLTKKTFHEKVKFLRFMGYVE
ncbi:MAG: hypothetical protein N3A54_01235 [Patescibacteria group bacterium]|nr:hypothetical protein [Patescibacteria group bacterium]